MKTEFGWVIERPGCKPQHLYFTITSGKTDWTADHNRAIRYARQDDAVMASFHHEINEPGQYHPTLNLEGVQVAQHGWDVYETGDHYVRQP